MASPSDNSDAAFPSVQLIAGPPAANPPLFIVALIVLVSLAAPVLFLKAGAPSPLFGIASIALALAGVTSAFAAVAARLRRQADLTARPRVEISGNGIALHRKPPPAPAEFFPLEHIDGARLLPGTFILRINAANPVPGRHVLRFGKPVLNQEQAAAALAALGKPG